MRFSLFGIDKAVVKAVTETWKLQRLDNCELKIMVNNIELDSVTHTKCLGAIIDNTLSFKFHVDSVVKSMQQQLGMIWRVKHLFTSSQLSTLYWGFVLPHAMYCSIVWSSRSESN